MNRLSGSEDTCTHYKFSHKLQPSIVFYYLHSQQKCVTVTHQQNIWTFWTLASLNNVRTRWVIISHWDSFFLPWMRFSIFSNVWVINIFLPCIFVNFGLLKIVLSFHYKFLNILYILLIFNPLSTTCVENIPRLSPFYLGITSQKAER